jgi:hypothetical protein
MTNFFIHYCSHRKFYFLRTAEIVGVAGKLLGFSLTPWVNPED